MYAHCPVQRLLLLRLKHYCEVQFFHFRHFLHQSTLVSRIEVQLEYMLWSVWTLCSVYFIEYYSINVCMNTFANICILHKYSVLDCSDCGRHPCYHLCLCRHPASRLLLLSGVQHLLLLLQKMWLFASLNISNLKTANSEMCECY